MAMREYGDVIALDQRGAGASRPDLDCDEPFAAPFDEPLHRSAVASMIAAEAKCAARPRRSGIDLAGYNTRENAADLEDLRKALGADKIVLWGTSYGTHLATAALRDYGPHIARVILLGVEGPDDTWKLPTDQQNLLEEIARRAAADPVIHGRLPDFLASLKNVLAELEARPKRVALVHPMNGRKLDVVVGKLDLRLLISQLLTSPETFSGLPDLVSRLERGDWAALALLAARQRAGEAPKAMPVAMDCASGATEARRKRIAEEASRTLLGDAINLPYPDLCAALNVPDLGDAFRAPLKSEVPALLISGTLDGRTPPRQAGELAAGMPKAVQVVIDGAGHSDPLFLSSPEILVAIQEFMRAGKTSHTRIQVTPKRFDHRDGRGASGSNLGKIRRRLQGLAEGQAARPESGQHPVHDSRRRRPADPDPPDLPHHVFRRRSANAHPVRARHQRQGRGDGVHAGRRFGAARPETVTVRWSQASAVAVGDLRQRLASDESRRIGGAFDLRLSRRRSRVRAPPAPPI
ncbi:MAG TPA: alpha/beta fold hydrolase [Thermoanaerobaculia bacterium]|nr:alpha/beta fold hydrolase [Thermoanaerobaculia bacterium]